MTLSSLHKTYCLKKGMFLNLKLKRAKINCYLLLFSSVNLSLLNLLSSSLVCSKSNLFKEVR